MRHVVFILIDGLGWDKLESVLGSGFPGVARFERDGVVSCITSQFPSTTADHHLALDQRGRTTW